MNFQREFIKLTQYTVPFGYELSIQKYLPDGYKRDKQGNYYYQIGKSDTLFTSHLDTASEKRQRIHHVIEGNIIKTDGTTILGGDNKAGCVILFYMIENKVPGTYYFFIGEEMSVHGNFPYGSLLAIENEEDKFKKFKRCISFDRKEKGQMVTRQLGQNCCSDEFANELISQFEKSGIEYKKDKTGYYTDGAFFVNVIPEIVNLSCGVYNEHHTNEYVDISYIESVAKAAVNINWENLPTIRKVETKYNADKRGNNSNEYKSEIVDANIFKEIFLIMDDLYFVCHEIRNYKNYLSNFKPGRIYHFSDWHNDIDYEISVDNNIINVNNQTFHNIDEFKKYMGFDDMNINDFTKYLIKTFNDNNNKLTDAEFSKLITLKNIILEDIEINLQKNGYKLNKIGKGYELIQSTLEKISWKSFLLALGIAYGARYVYKDYKYFSHVKQMYNIINSKDAIPTKNEMNVLNVVRRDVINQIKASNYKDDIKKVMIDSISTVDFKIVDNPSLDPDKRNAADASFLNITLTKKSKSLSNQPEKDNFILIDKELLTKNDSLQITDVITHEIYHYVDYLLGDGNQSYSETKNISKYLDKKAYVDHNYTCNKYVFLMIKKNIVDSNYTLEKIMSKKPYDNIEDTELKLCIDEIVNDAAEKKAYYSQPHEIFVRLKTTKNDMVRRGILKNINNPLTKESFLKYIGEFSLDLNKINDNIDILSFLVSVDWRKIEELDKQLNSN